MSVSVIIEWTSITSHKSSNHQTPLFHAFTTKSIILPWPSWPQDCFGAFHPSHLNSYFHIPNPTILFCVRHNNLFILDMATTLKCHWPITEDRLHTQLPQLQGMFIISKFFIHILGYTHVMFLQIQEMLTVMSEWWEPTNPIFDAHGPLIGHCDHGIVLIQQIPNRMSGVNESRSIWVVVDGVISSIDNNKISSSHHHIHPLPSTLMLWPFRLDGCFHVPSLLHPSHLPNKKMGMLFKYYT